MVNILEICDNCGKPTPDNEMNVIKGSVRLGIENVHVCAACLPSVNNAEALKKFGSGPKKDKDTSGETIDLNNNNNNKDYWDDIRNKPPKNNNTTTSQKKK